MAKINPKIFREYDIRGIVGEDLSDDFAYILGRAYAGGIRGARAKKKVGGGGGERGDDAETST